MTESTPQSEIRSPNSRSMFGFLNINKPGRISSRTVVDHVERIVLPEKVGHAGTLDPLATGVLVVAVGQATRLIEYVQAQPKRYHATFLLGRRSESEDIETTIEEMPSAPIPSQEQVESILPQFLGDIQQVPPTFSALKINGKRSYRLARRGKAVEMAARTITIFAIDLVSYEYPEIRLDIRCGSGTYVRSLGRDIARALGSEAVMSALVRTEIGAFHIADACPISELTSGTLPSHFQSPLTALVNLPKLLMTTDEVFRLRRGMTIACTDLTLSGEIAAVNSANELVAILTPREPGWLRPVRAFGAT